MGSNGSTAFPAVHKCLSGRGRREKEENNLLENLSDNLTCDLTMSAITV